MKICTTAISFLTNTVLSAGGAYSEVLSYVIRHQDSLIPTLTAQQKETFEKLKDCEAELHGMNERKAFISGFKLAARIMTEVLYEPSED